MDFFDVGSTLVDETEAYDHRVREIIEETNITFSEFDEEIAKFKEECVKTWETGKRLYQQSAAYILMLNTGLRTGELLGLLNSDIDLENRVLHINQAVKEV